VNFDSGKAGKKRGFIGRARAGVRASGAGLPAGDAEESRKDGEGGGAVVSRSPRR